VNVADLLACGDVFSGFRSAVEWCLAHRLSLRDLLSRSVSFLRSHTSTEHLTATVSSIPWLTEMARQHCQTAILELPLIFYRPFGVKPRSADISETWWLALKSQPHLKPSEIYRFEYRYPYLDRDLLDFLLRLPLDQLSQPGRRRYLMRLALQGIVPEEILERRRKAFLLASKLKHVQALAPRLLRAISTSCLAEAGYIDRHAVQRALESTTNGEDLRWWVLLTRFALLETWLQHRYRIVASDESTRDSVSGITSTNGLRAPKVAHLGLTVRENSAKGESQ
jgi:asparagine synthase (glutamine-hydrolysing)